LSLVENEKAKPSLGLVNKIEQEFDVPAAFLLWNADFQSRQDDSDLSERYKKLGEQMRELVTTLVRRKMGA
jgi:hypothetical protein